MSGLSHLDAEGRLRMVDVSEKQVTVREAIAQAVIELSPEVLRAIESNAVAKGNVLEAARLAGIMAAKRTSELIPLCHPLSLSFAGVEFETIEGGLRVLATARTSAQTGVEMEALTAATVAALTIYDMCKALDKAMIIREVFLREKRGGKSGSFQHPKR